MPLWAGFIGPAYRARSENIAADTLKNLYLETTAIGQEAKKSTFYGTPGLKPFVTTSDAGCRGGCEQDGLAYFVLGGTLVEVDPVLRTATDRGAILNDGNPVTFASNGRGGEQLAICAAGNLYVLNLVTKALSTVMLPLTNSAVMCDFIDGYLLLLEANTIRVWFSAPEDFTSINALDFFARSSTDDNVIGIKVVSDKIWTIGSRTSVAYYNSGDADNPFVPYPGLILHEGGVSPWAIGTQGENLIWMSQDTEGRNKVVIANGAIPQPISDPAIEFALSTYPSVSDVELLVYEQEAHPFAVFTCPSANNGYGVSWGVDARENYSWHQRMTVDPLTGDELRWRARGFCLAGGKYLVGDVASNAIYELDLDTFTDNGSMIVRERTAPYLSDDNQITAIDQIELGLQSGVGLTAGQGSDPVVMLALSEDGGHTWDECGTASMGAIGDYTAEAIWRRLGQYRADRLVVRIRQTDPVRAVWGPGLWLRATAGTGQR